MVKPASKPVGFRLPLPVFEFYQSLAAADRREVGAKLRNVLEDVVPVVRAMEANHITADEVLRRAGLLPQPTLIPGLDD